MAQDLLALAKWCDALPDRIEKAANEVKIAVTIEMAQDLIYHTPVDTSTAASNWQAEINGRPMFELPAIFPGERGSTAAESRREALAHVTRVADTADPGEIIYLSNLVPYIIDLNNGTSSQEPAGFFQRGILKGERYAAQVTLRF